MRVILMCICLTLASCSFNNSKIQLPSDSLLSDCIVSPPPLLTGNTEKDKLLLASAWSLQTSNLGKCNQKVKTMQIWKTNTIKRMGD